MTSQPELPRDPQGHVGPQIEVPHLEADESIPPRPEEEVADASRE